MPHDISQLLPLEMDWWNRSRFSIVTPPDGNLSLKLAGWPAKITSSRVNFNLLFVSFLGALGMEVGLGPGQIVLDG